MVWQKIDDGLRRHKKVVRIPRKTRLEVMGLWLFALNYSGDEGTNGILDESELEECLARPALVAQLVRVGLWHESGHDCAACEQPPADGVVIHDFLVYNPDAASSAEESEGKSVGGRYGNHVRWHEGRGKRIAGCDWCDSDNRSDTDRSTDRVGIASVSPGPVPGPDPQTDMTSDGQESHQSIARESDDPIEITMRERGITNLNRIRHTFGTLLDQEATDGEVVDLAGMVLDRSKGFVNNPEAYISAAVQSSRHEVAGYASEVQARSPRRLLAPHISPQLVALINERSVS